MSQDVQGILADFLLSRQAKGCAPSTIGFYEKNLRRFLAWSSPKELSELSPADIRAYLAYLISRGVKPHAAARCIRAWLRFVYRESYIASPILFEQPRYVRPAMRFLRDNEICLLLKACKKPREKAAISLLLDTALRRSEACALKWSDVSIDEGYLIVPSGKGKKSRVVGIGAAARRSLLKLPKRSVTVLGLRDSGLRMLVERVARRAGLSGVSCHVLRRTAATSLAKNGMGTFALQRALGHSAIATTLLYVELSSDVVVREHQKASPVDHLAGTN